MAGRDVRRKPLTRDRVVESALALIDSEGLDALTMRRLGRELGVEAMALYRHVRNKDDLLNAVAERVLDELEPLPPASADWRDRVRAAIAAWARLEELHPNAFRLLYRNRPVTDHELEPLVELVDALHSAGYAEREAALLYQTLIFFLDSTLFARRLFAGVPGAWQRGMEVVDEQRFPRYHEVARHGVDLRWEEVWATGVDLLVAGLEERLTTDRTPMA